MSLLDIATELKESGFDPKKDKVNGNSRIPAGEYNVIIDSIQYSIADSGWESMNIKTIVLDGQFKDRVELINIHFMEVWKGKETLPFILERNLKLAQKIGAFAGIKFKKSDFEDGKAICDALQPAEGLMMVLEIKESENKKDSSNPYRNYEISETEMVGSKEPDFEIDEKDMPF